MKKNFKDNKNREKQMQKAGKKVQHRSSADNEKRISSGANRNIAQNHNAVKAIPDSASYEEFSTAFAGILMSSGLSCYSSDEYAKVFYKLYCDLLVENSKHNLTAVTEYKKVILLHFADSLLAAEHIPRNSTVLDVGAGAGFPTFPLAIVRPDITVTAIDATAKKTGWIASETAVLGLANIKTINGRIEELSGPGGALRGVFDVTVARAVASLGILSEICAPSVKLGGLFIAMKGDSSSNECASMDKSLPLLGIKHSDTIIKRISEAPESELFTRNILVFEKIAKTDMKYPRMYSQIKKAPLF